MSCRSPQTKASPAVLDKSFRSAIISAAQPTAKLCLHSPFRRAVADSSSPRADRVSKNRVDSAALRTARKPRSVTARATVMPWPRTPRSARRTMRRMQAVSDGSGSMIRTRSRAEEPSDPATAKRRATTVGSVGSWSNWLRINSTRSRAGSWDDALC